MLTLSDSHGASQSLTHYYAGNDEAFTEFDRITRKPLMARAASLGAGPFESDELVSDVLAAVAFTKQRPNARWNSSRPLEPWLNRILKNKWISSQRSRNRREVLESDIGTKSTSNMLDVLAVSSEMTDGESPDEFQDGLSSAMSGLSNLDRQLLQWKYWENLSHRKISRQLKVSPATVTRRLSRTEERLREALLKYSISA